MKIVSLGLGKMGNHNMRARLKKGGVDVVGYDRTPTSATCRTTRRSPPRCPRPAWCGSWCRRQDHRLVIDQLAEVLEPGDMIVDGGNTKFTDDEVHGKQLDAKASASWTSASPAACGASRTATA